MIVVWTLCAYRVCEDWIQLIASNEFIFFAITYLYPVCSFNVYISILSTRDSISTDSYFRKLNTINSHLGVLFWHSSTTTFAFAIGRVCIQLKMRFIFVNDTLHSFKIGQFDYWIFSAQYLTWKISKCALLFESTENRCEKTTKFNHAMSWVRLFLRAARTDTLYPVEILICTWNRRQNNIFSNVIPNVYYNLWNG